MSLSCFDLGERMLSVDEALAAILGFAPTQAPAPAMPERLPLAAALGRVLAEDIASPIDVPQNTNAAMDGIALAWPASGKDALPEAWPLVGDALAGHGYRGEVPARTAVRITTGAPLPLGTDTVIMSEQLEEGAPDAPGAQDARERVRVTRPETVKLGQHVRKAGEDVPRGAVALTSGTRLAAEHLGLLASLGVDRVSVSRRLRVAIFSTGDEVTAPGRPLPADGIFDANRFSLHGLLGALGVEVTDLGILADSSEAMVAALREAAVSADMVITSGGVSVGQADWIKPALAETGELGFWRIAMRPGRPLAFGRLGHERVPFFGLPGNPVAVMVTFLQFVQPLIRRLQGEEGWQPTRITARAEEPLKSRAGRVDFLRGVYHADEEGQLWVRSTGRQGSGILSSMVAANCLIEIAAPSAGIATGETVTLQPLMHRCG
ncbi:gephyrin-like molybdotransferase Glp [Halomonas sp. YLGW01]|uniref:molybdopterin molybdotransferase MoeA n=1 Tax=Halomonas sp. YLGW01 TaxID=2773308 RepID=UPI00177F0AB3|nr:gephyrin-like molybdotransferase Glp [Halomonas sp. YLGW01]